MTTREGWERLARLVRERRTSSGWTQMEVATRGGLSLDRIQAIESARATRYSGRTLAKLERGLLWQAGSVRTIVETLGDPTPERPRRETVEEIAAENREELAEISKMLEEALTAKRGRPLNETQRRVTMEWTDSLERTIEALDDEAG